MNNKTFNGCWFTFLSLLLFVGFSTLALSPGVAVAKNNKVDVCHIPPGNPSNFHTITISEKALDAHLAHGDIAGGCFENCSTICDDGNLCTQDVVSDPFQCICQPVPGPTVNCDDSDACTIDSCDAALGCSNDAIFVAVGETGLTWSEASTQCIADGLNLASIHNDEEQACAVAALTAAGAPPNGGFIGLREVAAENNWLWIDGTPIDFVAWLAGEPSNDGGQISNVAHIWLNEGGGWNDVADYRTDFGYVCR